MDMMEVKSQKLKRGGTFKRIVGLDINARPDKDMRKSERLDTSVKNDHSLYGAGPKRDPKTGRMLPRYGDKNIRDNSIEYDRARYKNNMMRNLYSSARNLFQRCVLKGIPIDEKFYEMEHTHYRKMRATKDKPAIPKGEKFKDVIWGIRAYLVELWTECLEKDGGKCPCCPEKMVINSGGGMKHKHSRTIDRRIPDKGYLIGNMRFVCDHCNRIMSSGTVEDVINVLIYMLENDADLIEDFEPLNRLKNTLVKFND